MFVFIDTETGGLTPDYSLLTVAAAVTDKDFNVVSTLCFGLHPVTSYVTHPEAIRVNQIDLAKHAETAIYADTARAQLRSFLVDGAASTSVRRLIPAGHNVPFDLSFIWAHLIPESDWKAICGYPVYDTAVIARYLATANMIPNSCNLVALRKLFQIETGTAHNAANDVTATIEVAKHFDAILRGSPKS